jgi:hypothetical protein
MKNERTNWTTPKTNIISAANDLRKCLASGYKARLIKILNEDCQFPILLAKDELSTDFRDYEFAYGTIRTKAEILADTSMSNFEKKLSLEFHTCYGEEDAVKRYYTIGVLSMNNFKGMGKSHLVRVSDMITYLNSTGDKKDIEYAKEWAHYSDQEDARHFYDTFRLKNRQERIAKVFNHKLWAVEMLAEDASIPENGWLINTLMVLIKIIITPLKFIPERRVMIMDNYKWITYRIGDVTNGYTVEFHIPKKFSFRDKKK